MEFNTNIDHLQESTNLIINTSLLQCRYLNSGAIIEAVNKKISTNEDNVTPISIISGVESYITYEYYRFKNILKLLSLHLPDIISRGMIEEKYLQDNSIGIDDRNFPYNLDNDIITKLYTMTSFKDSLYIIKNKIKNNEVEEILNNYDDEYLDNANGIISPDIDYYLTDEFLLEWSEVKKEQIDNEILFIMPQHYLLIKILSKYKDIVLNLEQLEKAYLSNIKEITLLKDSHG